MREECKCKGQWGGKRYDEQGSVYAINREVIYCTYRTHRGNMNEGEEGKKGVWYRGDRGNTGKDAHKGEM